MLALAPRHLPALSLMLDDIGRPPSRDVAKVLGVTTRTVERWREKDDAPRCALLALFWLTRWGHSAVDASATNDARLQAALARAHADDANEARKQLAKVLASADFGCANEPVYRVR